MEKKEIKINFYGSGVLTLKGFGTFFMVIGIVAALAAGLMFIIFSEQPKDIYRADRDVFGLLAAVSFSAVSMGSFAAGAICRGLSGLARTALYQKLVLEQKYIYRE